jgi:single-strand DNA-binding protein
MLDKITLRGVVGTPPRHVTTSEGTVITSFRLASSQSYWDRTRETWVETETNWYTVTAFRQLASNAAVSVFKGDRVVVTGALKVREWKSGERTGLTVEVEAETIGLDLALGTGTFTRSGRVSAESQAPGEHTPDDRAALSGVGATPSLSVASAAAHNEPGIAAELGAGDDPARGNERVSASWSAADDPTPF